MENISTLGNNNLHCFYYRYPNPSEFTYEKRLFRPFEYAFQPPLRHEQGHIGVKKLDEMHPYNEQQCMTVRPQCFIIPGNHG